MSYIQEETENAKHGSIVTGILGAILGAFIGAIPWAIVYFFGFFSGWLAIIISFCAVKGYQLLGGKETKVKYVIIILAIVLGSIFGCAAGQCAAIGQMINDGDLTITYMNIPSYYFDALQQNEEFRNENIQDMVIGLLFAGVGAIYFLKTSKRTKNA